MTLLALASSFVINVKCVCVCALLGKIAYRSLSVERCSYCSEGNRYFGLSSLQGNSLTTRALYYEVDFIRLSFAPRAAYVRINLGAHIIKRQFIRDFLFRTSEILNSL